MCRGFWVGISSCAGPLPLCHLPSKVCLASTVLLCAIVMLMCSGGVSFCQVTALLRVQASRLMNLVLGMRGRSYGLGRIFWPSTSTVGRFGRPGTLLSVLLFLSCAAFFYFVILKKSSDVAKSSACAALLRLFSQKNSNYIFFLFPEKIQICFIATKLRQPLDALQEILKRRTTCPICIATDEQCTRRKSSARC